VHGCSEIEALHRAGFLRPGSQLVHGVWFDDAAAALLDAHRCGVVHCPVSNAYLASGVAPLPMLREHGVPIALAADGSASNHRQDPFETMKAATLLQRATVGDPTTLMPERALEMAWHGGAAVLGRAGRLGTLAEGAAADLVVLDVAGPHLQPMHDLMSALVFCALPTDVRHVIVAGHVVVRERTVTTVDVPALVRRCRNRAAALGLRGAPHPGGNR
jgi:5-methylthioadenosine/S-adenosylhomocysteine deaminase